MIVETAKVNTEDDIEQYKQVQLKQWLGSSYIYDVECIAYDIKGYYMVLDTWWIHDNDRHNQIDHNSNKMLIADNLRQKRADGCIHYLPGLCPLDVDQSRVEQAKFIYIHIIWKMELKNLSARLCNTGSFAPGLPWQSRLHT
jgi:hypothetical protein